MTASNSIRRFKELTQQTSLTKDGQRSDDRSVSKGISNDDQTSDYGSQPATFTRYGQMIVKDFQSITWNVYKRWTLLGAINTAKRNDVNQKIFWIRTGRTNVLSDNEKDKQRPIDAKSQQDENSKFATAICLGDLDGVKELIRSGIDLNAQSSNEETPLHLAIYSSRFEIAKELVRAGADLNAKSSNEETPLSMAIRRRKIDVVIELIRAGADINIKSQNRSHLSAAVEYNFTEAVNALIAAGGDVNLTTKNEDAPLHLAIYSSRFEIAKELVRAGADLNAKSSNAETPLSMAIRRRKIDVVNELIRAGADIHMKSQNRSPLSAAVEYNFTEAVNALIAAGGDVNLTTKEVARFSESYDTEMLQVARAITDNDISRLKTLVAHMYGSDVIKKSLLNILFIAAAIGTTSICQYLIDCGFTPDTLSLHRSILKVLPKNLRKNTYVSPLLLSMYYKRPGSIRLLLKHTSNCILSKCRRISSDSEQLLMKELSRRLMEKYRVLQPTVVVGYENGSPVLVVYSEELRDHKAYFCGQKVKFQNPRNLPKALPDDQPDIKENDMKIATQIINERSGSLWKAHSNLNIISMRSIKLVKGQEQSNGVCITLYCTSKGIIPLGEPRFPSELHASNGNVVLPVKVLEGYFEFCPGYVTSRSSTYHKNVKMGCSISNGASPNNGEGTLGPFVNINGEIGFLTCAHVLFDIQGIGYYEDTTASTKDVVQPAVGSFNVNEPGSVAFCGATRTPCGHVRRAVFNPSLPVSIDAAVVQITDTSRIPTEGHFAIEQEADYKRIGFTDIPVFNSGNINRMDDIKVKKIIKAGSTTHLTMGIITAIGTQVRPLSTTLRLSSMQMPISIVNQIEIKSFPQGNTIFEPGDSGSAVFTVNDDSSLECIGMAIGFTSYNTAVVTPITPILEALGPGVSLKTFPTPMSLD